MRSMTRRAFTLVEMLAGMAVLSCLLLFFLPHLELSDTSHLCFIEDYLQDFLEAYSGKKYTEVEGSGLHFNTDGNINLGKTLYFGPHHVIVHLANGYLTCD